MRWFTFSIKWEDIVVGERTGVSGEDKEVVYDQA